MLRSRRANVPSPRIISWYFPQPSRLTQMLSAWLPAKGNWALVVIVTEKKPTSRARSITSSIRLSPVAPDHHLAPLQIDEARTEAVGVFQLAADLLEGHLVGRSRE